MHKLYENATSNERIIMGFRRPFNIQQYNSDTLLISDMDLHCICKLDLQSNVYCWNHGSAGWSDPSFISSISGKAPVFKTKKIFDGPHSTLVTKGGSIAVLCYYSKSIYLLKDDCEAELAVSNNLLGPASMSTTPKGDIAVTDYGNNSISLFTQKFNFLGQIGLDDFTELRYFSSTFKQLPSTTKLGGFDRPHMTDFLSNGHLVVADTWNNRIKIYGNTIDEIISHDPNYIRQKIKCINISTPVSVHVDENDNMLVCSWEKSDIFLIDRHYNLRKLTHGFHIKKPYDALLLADKIVIADSHNGRLIISENSF